MAKIKKFTATATVSEPLIQAPLSLGELPRDTTFQTIAESAEKIEGHFKELEKRNRKNTDSISRVNAEDIYSQALMGATEKNVVSPIDDRLNNLQNAYDRADDEILQLDLSQEARADLEARLTAKRNFESNKLRVGIAKEKKEMAISAGTKLYVGNVAASDGSVQSEMSIAESLIGLNSTLEDNGLPQEEIDVIISEATKAGKKMLIEKKQDDLDQRILLNAQSKGWSEALKDLNSPEVSQALASSGLDLKEQQEVKNVVKERAEYQRTIDERDKANTKSNTGKSGDLLMIEDALDRKWLEDNKDKLTPAKFSEFSKYLKTRTRPKSLGSTDRWSLVSDVYDLFNEIRDGKDSFAEAKKKIDEIAVSGSDGPVKAESLLVKLQGLNKEIDPLKSRLSQRAISAIDGLKQAGYFSSNKSENVIRSTQAKDIMDNWIENNPTATNKEYQDALQTSLISIDVERYWDKIPNAEQRTMELTGINPNNIFRWATDAGQARTQEKAGEIIRTTEDNQALEWARDNESDPRAKEILSRLGED